MIGMGGGRGLGGVVRQWMTVEKRWKEEDKRENGEVEEREEFGRLGFL